MTPISRKITAITWIMLVCIVGLVAGHRLALAQCGQVCRPCDGVDGAAPTGSQSQHQCFQDTQCSCPNGVPTTGWCRLDRCRVCGSTSITVALQCQSQQTCQRSEREVSLCLYLC